MFLYRAINEKDIKNYLAGKNITCTLLNTCESINTFSLNDRDKILSDCRDYFIKERKYALNGILGHVNGAKFKCNRSPWVSTSSNLKFVLEEYAIPQSGEYNWSDGRKPVIVINYADSKVFKDIDMIKRIREDNSLNEFAIDLRDNNLEKLYDADVIENEVNFGFRLDNDGNVVKTKIPCFKRYATNANEVLVYKEIKKEDVKIILYPLLQDIIYSCNIDIEKNYGFILQHINDIYNIINRRLMRDIGLKKLYPSISESVNLTDILYNNYRSIEGYDINEKYNNLKRIKKERLTDLVEVINLKLNTSLKVDRIIDDNIKVCPYGKMKYYNTKQLNDIVLVENNGKVYKYFHKEKAYVSKDNEKLLKK